MYVLIFLNIIKAIFKTDMTKVKIYFIEKNEKNAYILPSLTSLLYILLA